MVESHFFRIVRMVKLSPRTSETKNSILNVQPSSVLEFIHLNRHLDLRTYIYTHCIGHVSNSVAKASDALCEAFHWAYQSAAHFAKRGFLTKIFQTWTACPTFEFFYICMLYILRPSCWNHRLSFWVTYKNV